MAICKHSACHYMQKNFSPVGAQRQSLSLPDSQLRPTIAQRARLLQKIVFIISTADNLVKNQIFRYPVIPA